MHDPGDDPELARLVSESFVADMDASFREMGVGDLSVAKRMDALYRSFAGRMSAYKKGVEEGEEALLDAVARNVFPDGGADARALALRAHLAAAVAAVRAADLEAIRRGDLPFPEPSL
jgi:cytochrome b pre-mRNA-processing protein 3